MGTYRKEIDKRCPKCGTKHIEISMKSPYVDDCDDACPNTLCSAYQDVESKMHGYAQSAAFAEKCAERDEREEFEREEYQENDDEE